MAIPELRTKDPVHADGNRLVAVCDSGRQSWIAQP